MFELIHINEDIKIGIINLKEFSEKFGLTQKREIEVSGRQALINFLLGEDIDIVYNDKGKPFIKNDIKHISITHSHDKLAVIINEKQATGIDIELIRDKVLKIKHKFLSGSELNDANDNVTKLIIYWAVKESLYKVYGEKEVDFIKHLKVLPFTLEDKGKIFGKIEMETCHHFELEYRIIENYALVYCLRKLD
jgi:4'-phosphopantetheinyl transferase